MGSAPSAGPTAAAVANGPGAGAPATPSAAAGLPGRGPALASGRTADLYPWAAGWVVKLYQPWVSERTARSEQARTQAAANLGVAVPQVGPVVQVGERWGLVLQRIEGASMMARLLQQDDGIEASAGQLAALHHQLGRPIGPGELPDQATGLRARLEQSAELTAAERQAALAALAALPTGDRLCHGDLHPGNVLIGPAGPVLIDWMDASRGAPAADMARTLLLCDGSIATASGPDMAREAMQAYRQAYVDTWTVLDTQTAHTWPAWTGVLAAARLGEPVPEQQAWLRACMRRELGVASV